MIVMNTRANVVIVAHRFNPSIITQLWLVKNNILQEDEFEEGCIVTPVLSQIRSRKFQLVVVQEQLQFAPIDKISTDTHFVSSKVGKIVRTLPQTPYSAVGMNFVWHIDPKPDSVENFSRSIFYSEGKPLYRVFDTIDARFGAYMSKNILGCRLKLDVKPVTVTINNQRNEQMQFAFNFHLDLLEDDKVSEILALLEKWGDAANLASKIIGQITEDKL